MAFGELAACQGGCRRLIKLPRWRPFGPSDATRNANGLPVNMRRKLDNSIRMQLGFHLSLLAPHSISIAVTMADPELIQYLEWPKHQFDENT